MRPISSTATPPAQECTVQAIGLLNGNGNALDVHGRTTFTRSGILTIANKNNGLTGAVPGCLTGTSHVLATMQSNSGTLAVRAAVPITTGANAGRIQIFLTGNAPAGGVKVGWVVFGSPHRRAGRSWVERP
jgi:hypothetical protein